MSKVQKGDTVRVHYTGKLDDGTVFDSSEGREPLEFTVGAEQVIPGFEQAVEGMEEGETRSVTIPANEAYGEHREDLVVVIPRNQLPPDIEPEIGMQLQVREPTGQSFVVTVTAFDDETVTLDANHPLAGKDLTFDIEVVEIIRPS
ncbi:MAG: peptidylprolyl isomerase [Ardenticatenia bacterium]|nr:MAG: peptidylprolyl isomerase [Ardenticatenia bacterium]